MHPTLRQVAAAAGVHHTTLSRALRGHPDVSAGKAAELRALAKKMGYVPDPMLSALAAYRTGRRPAAFHSVIAYINPTPNPADARRFRSFRDFFDFAESRGRELGFRLELIPVPDDAGEAARITPMLKARNVTGVIVGPVTAGREALDMIDWSAFSAVKIDHSVRRPRLHVVASEHIESMTLLMDELIARGYRRPGLLLSNRPDRDTGMQSTAMFLRHQLHLPRKDRLPPHLSDRRFDDFNAELAPWIQKHEPDAIIVLGDEKIPPLLRKAGICVPDDLGLAVLTQPNEGPAMSGIVQHSGKVGAAALDFVVAMMNRQERGIPSFSQTLSIHSEWLEGGTLRPRPRERRPATRR